MNDQSSPHVRKLLPGERVEVRQKEKGLRGSWHPATVVGLKPSRRLVEYDELLTEDGLHKLRESIPVGKSLEAMRGSARHTVSSPRHNEALRGSPRLTVSSTQPKIRGFLRPLPPRCTDPPQSWKRGFMVDVFYQDAWWEAVLLDDLVSMGEDSLINVMFPDEGDAERVPVRNLRVSQEWDEDTGQWSVKGKCNLSELLKRTGLEKLQTGLKIQVNGRRRAGVVDSSLELSPSLTSSEVPTSPVFDDKIKCSEAVTDLNSPVCDDEVKGCEAEADQSSPTFDYKVIGSEAETVQHSQVLVDKVKSSECVDEIKGSECETHQAKAVDSRGSNFQPQEPLPLFASNIEAVPSTIIENVGREVMAEEASLVKRLSFSEWINEKETIHSEPVQLSCPEDSGNCASSFGLSVPGVELPEGLTGMSEVPYEKQQDSSEDLKEYAACTKKTPLYFHAEAGRGTVNDLPDRDIANRCSSSVIGSATHEVPSGKAFEDDAIRAENKQGGESHSPSLSVDDTSVQVPVDDISYMNPFEGFEHGMARCGEKTDSSKQNCFRDQSEVALSKGENDAKADTSSTHSNQQGGSFDLHKPIMDDVADTAGIVRRKAGRLPRRGAEERSKTGDVPMKSDRSVQIRVVSKEERLRRGLMSIEIARFKGKSKLGNSSAEPSKASKAKAAVQEEKSRTGWRDENVQVSHSPKDVGTSAKTGGTIRSSKENLTPKNTILQTGVLKNKVRDIAKEALQEAGFRIEFRPRKNKDYQDSVYVSPQGSTYWSLPNAWRAWKSIQAGVTPRVKKGKHSSSLHEASAINSDKKGVHVSGTCMKGADKKREHLGTCAKGVDKRQGLLRIDRGDRRASLGTNQEMLLQSALENACTTSARALNISQHQYNQLHLTNSQLTDLFLEDLGVLKRITQKAKARAARVRTEPESDKTNENKGLKIKKNLISKTPKFSLPDSIEEKKKKKPKNEGVSSVEKRDKKILSRRLSFNRKQREGGAISEKTGPSNKGLVQKKGGGKVSLEDRSPVHLQNRIMDRQEEIGPSNKCSVQKKGGGKVSLEVRSPVHLQNRMLLRQEEIGPSNKCSVKKKGGGKVSLEARSPVQMEKNKTLVRQEKSGKRLKSEGHSGFEHEPIAKKSRGSVKEKTPVSNVIGKKRKAFSADSVSLLQTKSKKSKVMPSKQEVSHDKKGKNQRVRSGCRLEVRTAASRKGEGSEASSCKNKQTVLSWMIDRGVLSEREKLCYMNWKDNQIMKEGLVTREGIFCKCCKKIYTISSFEVHAGSHVHRPGRNIVLNSGRSFSDCQLQAWDIETQLRKQENYVGVTDDDRNDDTCLLCGDGGDLICCDHCPSTFHTSCLQIEDVPEGNWYCPKCCCAVCGSSQYDDKVADLGNEEFLSCSQCEHEYHISCLHGGCIVTGDESFCGQRCQKIFSGLQEFIGIPHPLDGGFSWTLLRCGKKDWESESPENLEVIAEQHSKLAVALLVMQECFVPMDDPRTNIDMIPHVLNNCWSEFDRLNYEGFYTVILEKEEEIISVASIRVHGARLAEMPLIGTRQQYRRQGMCRRLVNAIEKMLTSLEVEKFVLPAIPELLETWTCAFGFQPLDASQRLEQRDLSMMVFPGTQLLQKSLSNSELVEDDAALVGTQLLQTSCSSSELVEVDAASADRNATELYCKRLEPSSFSSNLLECSQEVVGQPGCAPSKFELLGSVAGKDLRDESYTVEQGFKVHGRDGDMVHAEPAENSNQCRVDAASISCRGFLEDSTKWRIETADPVLPLTGGPEELQTHSEEALVEQAFPEQCQAGLTSSGMLRKGNHMLKPDEMNSVLKSQNELHILPPKFLEKVIVCTKTQPDHWNEKVARSTNCSEDQVNCSWATSPRMNLSKEQVRLESDGVLGERMCLPIGLGTQFPLSQTYGRKRRRQVVDGNCVSGNGLQSSSTQVQQLNMKDAIETTGRASINSTACHSFDDSVKVAHDSSNFIDLNVEPCTSHSAMEERLPKDGNGCLVSTSIGQRPLLQSRPLLRSLDPLTMFAL